MSAFSAIVAALQDDATLDGMLTGGIYDGLLVSDVSRQATPNAYDEFGELLPCALVKLESTSPAGPLHDSARTFVTVWLYAQHDLEVIEPARERVYRVLHRQKVGAAADGVFEVRHANDVLGAEVQGLDHPMILSRFAATVWRG